MVNVLQSKRGACNYLAKRSSKGRLIRHREERRLSSVSKTIKQKVMKPTTDEQYIDALIAYRVTSYTEAFENNRRLKKVLYRLDFKTDKNFQRVKNKIADNNTALQNYQKAERLTPVDNEKLSFTDIAIGAVVIFIIFKIFFHFILK